MSPRPPRVIGPYRVVRPVAQGGMAEVYEVEDTETGEHLALKLLVAAAGAVPRFAREYEAMVRLNHPSVARVYTWGVYQGTPWMTLELVAGTPVQSYVKSLGRPGAERRNHEVLRIARDLALALDYVHRRGLVHRDLKSANVLVLPDGRVKLIDFGTAALIDARMRITSDREFVGTYAYAAPEQIQGQRVEARTDLYSYGVLLYRLLTGRRVFEDEDPRVLARRHVRDEPLPPRDFVPDLPERLEALVLHLLRKRPADRPRSGRVVADALEEIAGGSLDLPVAARWVGSPDRLVGREVEESALLGFLDGSVDAPGATALVVGHEGSGRQRMITAAVDAATSRGWRISHWLCRRQDDGPDGVLRALHASAFPLPTANDEPDRSAVRAAVASLAAVDDARPFVLFAAGLHLPRASAVRALALARDAAADAGFPLIVVASTDMEADLPGGVVRGLLPDAVRIRLEPLGVGDVGALIGAILRRRPPPPDVARAIADVTGGLPSWIEEIVRGLVASGALRERGGDPMRIAWDAADRLPVDVPRAAAERVVERFSTLSGPRRRVLEALAAAGGDSPVATLAAALGRDVDLVGFELDHLVEAGWVRVSEADGRRVVHWLLPLAERVLLGQLSRRRLRVLQRNLAPCVAGEPAFPRQVTILLAVGRVAEAAARAREWGLAQLARYRPLAALAVLDEVAPHLEGHLARSEISGLHLLQATCGVLARPADPRTGKALGEADRAGVDRSAVFQAELHLVRAWVQRAIGHFPNARKHLEQAWELVEPGGPADLSVAVSTQFAVVERLAGALDRAAGWLGKARRRAAASDLPRLRAQVDAAVAAWELAAGHLVEADRTARQALAVLGPAGDLVGLADAVPVRAEALRLMGRVTEAIALWLRDLRAIRAAEVPSWTVRWLVGLARCEVALCRLGRAQEWVDELTGVVRSGEHIELRLQADRVRGEILVASGQAREAEGVLRTVVERSVATQLPAFAEGARAAWAEAAWASGASAAARDALHSAVDRLGALADVPELVAAVCSRARVLGDQVDANLLFLPLRAWMDAQPALPLRIEHALAGARRAVKAGDDPAPWVARARAEMTAMAGHLGPMERAVLDLHPWARQLPTA